ncbi:MAG: hypothetical protein M1276_01250 [Deltaproteobacteria bacterium]|jgi:hypothetical protein|nr:hypothetical protein [Deltaproteobacteria bacterium]
MEKCNLKNDLSHPDLRFIDLNKFSSRLTRKAGYDPEVLKRAVKDSFLDFIDTHTNSHGVFICGSKKLVEFVEDNLI